MQLKSLKIIYLLFFLSGAAGLIYEIVWARLLVLIFGSTTNSIVAVISAFLGGLAIGSLLFGQIADRLSAKRLIKTYALLEIGVGLFATSTLVLLNFIREIYSYFSDGSTVSLTLLLIKFALTIFVLFLPTILMGATLPILIRFAQTQNRSISKSVSLLYATNTLGGVAGILISAFALIELIGLENSLLIAVFLNLTIGIIANFITDWQKTATFKSQMNAKRLHTSPAFESSRGFLPPDVNLKNKTPALMLEKFIKAKENNVKIEKSQNLKLVKIFTGEKLIILVAFFLSGLISIAYEVLWARIFTPTIGTLIYAFATVLAIYILGIGIGSFFYQKFAKITKGKNLAFAICEVGIGLAAIVSIIATHKIEIDNSFRIAAIVLPATILMGLTFPTVVTLLREEKYTGKIIGVSYFANTIGSITGGFLASFFFIPSFGSSKSILILAILNFTIGLIFVFKETTINVFLRYSISLAILILITSAFWLLTFKGNRLTEYTTDLQILNSQLSNREYAFIEDEVASIFAFKDPANNDQGLFIDGVATTSRVSETRFMAHIPIALHENPQKVLVIAFGMGTTFRSSLAQNLETDAVELVPSVPSLMHFFHEDARQVLSNPKGRIIINDGRNYVFLTNRKYDIVTIDPPPPFNAAGTTVLHSKEFYEDIKKILNPNGIVSQWIYYNGSREDDIAMAINSFIEVFPNVLAFQKVGSVGGIFLQGSFSPLDPSRINQIFVDKEAISDLEEVIIPIQNETLKDRVSIELIGDHESLYEIFGKYNMVSDKHPRTEYFKLRYHFTISPKLVEQESLVFQEKLKNSFAKSQKYPQ